jgi:hypothetical protein
MDRRSFIKQSEPEQIESTLCGVTYCVCEEIPMEAKIQEIKSANTFHLFMIGFFAFLSAFVFAEYNTYTSVTDVTALLHEKKGLVISCRKKLDDDRTPGNKNDKNSCSHQQLTLTLSERKKIRHGSGV